MTGFLAWLNRDVWGPIWPNLVASLVWAPAAFAAHHVGMRRHHERVTAAQTEILKAHINATLAPREGRVP